MDPMCVVKHAFPDPVARFDKVVDDSLTDLRGILRTEAVDMASMPRLACRCIVFLEGCVRWRYEEKSALDRGCGSSSLGSPRWLVSGVI